MEEKGEGGVAEGNASIEPNETDNAQHENVTALLQHLFAAITISRLSEAQRFCIGAEDAIECSASRGSRRPANRTAAEGIKSRNHFEL